MYSKTTFTWSSILAPGKLKEAFCVLEYDDVGSSHNGKIAEAHILAMPEKKSVSRSAMVLGYVYAGELNSVVRVVAWMGMITGFRKIKLAEKLYKEMPMRNLVTGNTTISGYAENCRLKDGLKPFRTMVENRVRPNPWSFSNSVGLGCTILSELEFGKHVHQPHLQITIASG
ncbi:hypothetical protein HHK36_028079 [Tetracentron sinense]|uniref:Pentatricopeptide repeat-containing protein n=1 Tax=Tetracentron sinense TaxID=13715 RepID=A0A835D443_TETSI|nr:hypothetical protein HHK36_028079 [Tetracentron sinense]